MSDTLPNSDDPINSDLQAALAAAFGDEAANWEDDASSADGASSEATDIAALASMLEAADAADAAESSEVALDDLLKKVSSAIDDSDMPVKDASDEDEEEAQVDTGVRTVVFEVGDHQFGLPLSGVLEIDRCGQVTALPRTPHWLRGVTNLRGQILSVTDFSNLLNLSTDRSAVGEKIIVVHSKRHASSTALVVDRVLGIRNLNSDRGPLSGLSDRVANFSEGISVTDQATTVLIDPDLLLGCDELSAFSSK